MSTGIFFRGVVPFVHGTGVLVALAAVAALPPVTGRILLVPQTPDAARHLARVAIDHGALPVVHTRAGLLVEGRGGGLTGAALTAGILPIAGHGGSCGEGAAG